MHRLNATSIMLAISLSALAGCVDAIGFLQLGGHFISFMSGNSTQLAVGMATHHLRTAIELAAIIILFVGGAIVGTLVGEISQTKMHVVAVLSVVTALLVGAAICASMGWILPVIILITLAMGAENAVFQRDGEVIVGITYMTGTLVKMGQRIAHLIMGGEKYSWIPYLLLWLGLITGGTMGALLFQVIGLQSLWIAALCSAFITVVAYWKNPFKA